MRSPAIRTALVSGAGWGTGRAVCLKLLNEGYHVVGTTFNSSADIAHERFYEIKLDLSDTQSIDTAIGYIQLGFMGEWGGIDLLVNAAGIGYTDLDYELSRVRLERIFAVNVIGTLQFTEGIIPLIKPGGLLVNMSIILQPGNPGYRLAASALKTHSELLSKRLQPQRIAVTMLQLSREQAEAGIVPVFEPVSAKSKVGKPVKRRAGNTPVNKYQ